MDIIVAIELRTTPARILIRDNFNYVAAGWNLSDVSVCAVVTGPAGSIYDNDDFDNPDIEPAISLDLNRTINLPMDPAEDYQNIVKGNYTVKITRYNQALDETEETLETFSYQFDKPIISNRTVSGPYTGTLKSTDTTDYGQNVYLLTRAHTIKYPVQLDPLPGDVVSALAEVIVTPIYTNMWTVDISADVEYRNPDELRIYWSGSDSFSHYVYGGCIGSVYSVIKQMLADYYDTQYYQERHQEAQQKRLVTINTAWHLLNVAYESGDEDEADYQFAIIQDQIKFAGLGDYVQSQTSEEVTPCPPYEGGGSGSDYTFQDGLNESSGVVGIGGLLTKSVTISALNNSFIVSGINGGKTSAIDFSHERIEVSANESTKQGRIIVDGTKVNIEYNDSQTPANSRKYEINENGFVESADYSASYTSRSLISLSYFLSNNNWGAQVVQSDATLTGSGTIADPLKVAVPFPGFTTLEDDYGYEEPSHAFSEITDTPTTLSGYGITDAVDRFTDLTDTPSSYTGHANKFIRVKADESGVEFVASSGFVPDTGGTFTGQVIFNTTNDYPIVLRQSGAGSQVGTPEAGYNLISFEDNEGDQQGFCGIDSSGNYIMRSLVAAGFIIAKNDLQIEGNIEITGTVDGVAIAAFKTDYDSHTHSYLNLEDLPTTLYGYGITDAMSNQDDTWDTEFDNKPSASTGDYILIEDVSDGNKKKYVTIDDLPVAAATFLGLSDTPSSYSGQALKFARVNSGANALEFVSIASLYLSVDDGTIDSLTEKTTPVSDDVLIIEDSEDSFAQKKILLGNLSAAYNSFENGITQSSGVVKLGGVLTGNTDVSGNDSGKMRISHVSSGIWSGFMEFAGSALFDVKVYYSQDDYTGYYTSISMSDQIVFLIDNGVNIQSIEMNYDGHIIIKDDISETGIKYDADYSANFTDRSLVDKGYVLSLIAMPWGEIPNGNILYWDTAENYYSPYASEDKASGRFYSGETDPTNYSERLNYDGNFYAYDIQATGLFRALAGAYASALFPTGLIIEKSGSALVYMTPYITDDSDAIAYVFGTDTELTVAGSRIMVLKNTTSTVFSVDKDGNVNIPAGSEYRVNGVAIDGGDVEGTDVLSTGETGGTKFLREDGDGTCSWQTVSSGVTPTDSPLFDWDSGNSYYTAYADGSKGDGRFYLGTTDPSNTTRLNYDGYLHATRFYGNVYTLDGSERHLTINAGNASGSAGTDAGNLTLKAGHSLSGDSLSMPGRIKLEPGYNSAYSSANIDIGSSSYAYTQFDIMADSSAANCGISIIPKGTGTVSIGNSLGMLILSTNNLQSSGDLLFRGERNASISGANGAGSDGFTLTIKGGSGSGTDKNGGNLYLYGGTPTGTGTRGNVFFGTGVAGYLPAKASETNVVYYDDATGKLSYGTISAGVTPADSPLFDWDSANSYYNSYAEGSKASGRFYSFDSTYPSNTSAKIAYDGQLLGTYVIAADRLYVGTSSSTRTEIYNSQLNIYIGGTLRTRLGPGISDGASAVAYIFDTSNAYATEGAKLMSVLNNGSEKFYIDKDGNPYSNGAMLLTQEQLEGMI